jgi:hypothetical protein
MTLKPPKSTPTMLLASSGPAMTRASAITRSGEVISEMDEYISDVFKSIPQVGGLIEGSCFGYVKTWGWTSDCEAKAVAAPRKNGRRKGS